MNTNAIILKKCEKFIQEILEFFSENKIRSIEEMETYLKQLTDKFMLGMIKSYLEALDKAIVEDKAGRKQKEIIIERKNDKRELYTIFGNLIFKRTYFYDKRRCEYLYLLDKVVGLEGYERITPTVELNLAEHASQYSYAKSSQNVTGGAISRQTVMRKLRSLSGLKKEAPDLKRKVRELHIDVDEDHVSLQDGSKVVVPLISIYEGIKRDGKRGECININHISGYGKSSEEIWLEAADWIYNTYDIDSIEKIYIHGDGALWIKEGIKWLPKAKLVLDKYHLNKAILQATGGEADIRQKIYKAIREGNQQRLKETIKELHKKASSDKKKKKRIKDLKRYILNNWDAIKVYTEEGCISSSPEGHVSHVLSSRLSSRPMGWSKRGLKVMAELRAYVSSGGKLTLKHLRAKKEDKSYKINENISLNVSDNFKEVREQIRNITILAQGKVTPIFRCLKGLRQGSIQL